MMFEMLQVQIHEERWKHTKECYRSILSILLYSQIHMSSSSFLIVTVNGLNLDFSNKNLGISISILKGDAVMTWFIFLNSAIVTLLTAFSLA